MIKAVIFDMDGTMFDTEILWGEINHLLAKKYGVVFEEKLRVNMMGRNDFDSLSFFKKYYALTDPVEEIIKTRREIILSDLDKVKVNPGLYEILELLDKLSIKKAIATSSFREFTTRLIKKFGLEKKFETIVTGEDISVSKPNPEIFFKAATNIDIAPINCLVIEDAQNGIEAAYAAGMISIAIPHDESSSHDFSKATKILKSFKQIDEKLIKSF